MLYISSENANVKLAPDKLLLLIVGAVLSLDSTLKAGCVFPATSVKWPVKSSEPLNKVKLPIAWDESLALTIFSLALLLLV